MFSVSNVYYYEVTNHDGEKVFQSHIEPQHKAKVLEYSFQNELQH